MTSNSITVDDAYNNWRLLFEQIGPLEMECAKTALLVIDMQYYDAHPDYGMGLQARQTGRAEAFDYYWRRVAEIVPRIGLLLQLARRTGVRVVFTRIEALTPTCDDISPLYRLCNIRVPANSEEAQILPELAPAVGDIVLSKSSSSVFNSTAINQVLRNLRIETLIICGVVLSGCVESSVRDAADLGYRVVLIPDASADLTPELEAASLSNLEGRFAQTRSTQEVIDLINGARSLAV
jgi:ureidoacrylate peracid hydrolase